MYPRRTQCGGVLWFVMLNAALCHVVWQHPTPRYDRDNKLKKHPCGSGGQLNDWSAPTTVLSPGKQLLEFRETIVHAGAPCRIALTVGSDSYYDEYVLLDHIPHNNGAQKVNGEVLHAVEIEMPSVDCTNQNCGLQLIQVMTDKFPSGYSCENPQGLAESCGNPAWSYFSCANVQIEGGTVVDPDPIYRSWTAGSADSREPYVRGEVAAWCFDSEKQHWRLHGNGYNCPGMEPTVDELETDDAAQSGTEEPMTEEDPAVEEESVTEEEPEEPVMEQEPEEATEEGAAVSEENDQSTPSPSEEAGEEEDEEREDAVAQHTADVKLTLRFPLERSAVEAQRAEIVAAVAAALEVPPSAVSLGSVVEVSTAGVTEVRTVVEGQLVIAVEDGAAGRSVAAAASESALGAAMESLGIGGVLLAGAPAVVERSGGAGTESAGSARGGASSAQAAGLVITTAVTLVVLSAVSV